MTVEKKMPNQTCTTRRRFFTAVLTLWFTVVSMLGNPALAQTESADFEPPIIEHEEISVGVLGETESFDANVVDNEDLTSVSLFYRYAGDSEFVELDMQPIAYSSSYTARVDTRFAAEGTKAIEYYIRAEDVSGNQVLKGFAFEPLVRTLNQPDFSGASSEGSQAEQDGTGSDISTEKKVNWLYVGLGVLLLGGIAAAGGGGGGSDSSGASGSCENECQVTLIIDTP